MKSPAFSWLLAAVLMIFVGFPTPVSAQGLPGYVLVDDMYLPWDAVYGDSTFTGTPWTGGVVPYTFDANVNSTNQNRAVIAMAEWAAVADIVFVPRTSQSNYIIFKDDTGNSSYVGMIGGGQTIRMYNWSFRYILCHEIGHAIGLKHEHQRPDRNTYVQINTANITSSAIGNFNISSSATTYGAYDFDSIMHYDDHSFSSNGGTTITCISPYQSYQNQIGNRDHLSLLDAQGMATRYGPAPVPAITNVSPPTATPGQGVTLTIDGGPFLKGTLDGGGVQGSIVRWNNQIYSHNFISGSQVTVYIPGSAMAGNGSLTIENPAPGGGLSNGHNYGTANGPTPDPMTFAIAPTGASQSSITMTATTATAPVGGVQYYFTMVSSTGSGGSNSNWQTSPTYTDFSLDPNTSYQYQVVARDSSTMAQGSNSSSSAGVTHAATPGEVSLSNITPTSFSVSDIDDQGNPANTLYAIEVDGQYMSFLGPLSPTEQWLPKLAWLVATGPTLTAGVPHSVRAKARNSAGVETAFGPATGINMLGSAARGNVLLPGGGYEDVLLVNGSEGGLFRTVEVPIGQPFTFTLSKPTFNPSSGANFFLMAWIGIPQPSWEYSLGSLGTLVFPPCDISGPGGPSFNMASSYGPTTCGEILPGAAPAPWSFSHPGLTFGIPALTMQGVVEFFPGVLRTTNAIVFKSF